MAADIHNLNTFQLANFIVQDIPKALEQLNACENLLTPFRKFKDVDTVLESIIDAKTMLKIHLESQQEIINKKGKIND